MQPDLYIFLYEQKMILRGKLRYTKVFNWDPFSNLKELYHESLEESYFSHLLTQIIRVLCYFSFIC